MKPSTVLDIHSIFGQEILAGSGAGKVCLGKLIEATLTVPPESLIALDLRKTELVTASFFRTSFKAFRDYVAGNGRFGLIHLCKGQSTIEEVTAYADDLGDAFLFGDINKQSEITDAFLIGKLDAKQKRTLIALSELGEADAATLFNKYPEQPALATSAAWSNRLASLASKCLVSERLEGRSKLYRPLVEGIRHGV